MSENFQYLVLVIAAFALSVVPLVYLQVRRDTLVAVLRLMADGKDRTVQNVVRDLPLRISECRAQLHLATLEERGLVFGRYLTFDACCLHYRITGDGRRELAGHEGAGGGFDNV